MDNNFKNLFVDGIFSMFEIKGIEIGDAKAVPALIVYSNGKGYKYCLTINCEYKDSFSWKVISELEKTLSSLEKIENVNKLEIVTKGKNVTLYVYSSNKAKLTEYKKALEEIKGE